MQVRLARTVRRPEPGQVLAQRQQPETAKLNLLNNDPEYDPPRGGCSIEWFLMLRYIVADLLSR